MPIIAKLVELYRSQGIDICTGLTSHDFGDLPSAPFTRFFKDGRSMTGGYGIAMQEVYFLENLFSAYKPNNVFIIGNSLGWSTLAIGLASPNSRIVAMDAGFDENSLHGIDLTNQLAKQAGLDIRAVKGVSPQDVASIADTEFGGAKIDFSFIDGLHTNEQIVLDYKVVAAKSPADAVYLFHDVNLFDLYEGIRNIENLSGQKAKTLRATPSGITLMYNPAQHPEIDPAIAPFNPTPEALAMVEREAWRHNNPHAGRWQRSFIKKINSLRKAVGAEPLPVPSKL